MAPTQMIILNGGSSSGKSGIVRCLQSILPDPWLAFGCDQFIDALPAKMQASDQGIAFAADGSHAFVASASQRAVLSFDLSGNRTDFACACAPSELTPMGTSFRLNQLGSDPVWLLDGGANARIVFVPALAASR